MCRPDEGSPISTSPGAIVAAIDNRVARDRADDEPGDIVLAVGVEAGHLGGLAAEQRAAVLAAGAGEPLDHLHRDGGLEPAGRQVVEKEERPRALDEDVVDAVVDEIDADGAVDARHEGDAQLGADAVGARDEHGILRSPAAPRWNSPPNEPMSDRTPGVNVPRARDLDPAHDLVARVDVDACLLVVHQNSSV